MKLRIELKTMRKEIISINGVDYCIHQSANQTSLPVIVFLHGFTGSKNTWAEIINLLNGSYHTIAIDLMGHGETSMPQDFNRYSMDNQIADLYTLLNKLDISQFTLVGYSMGGRIALSYTISYPEHVTSLVLESSTPGLKTDRERKERVKKDKLLAQKIRREGIAQFVNFWESIPLFNSQKKLSKERQQIIRDERLEQREVGLANSLLGIGTGSQPSYWPMLKEINCPVFLITGEVDKKFVNIAQEMIKILRFPKHRIVKDAGHAIHVEKPTIFATMIEEHVQEIILEEEK